MNIRALQQENLRLNKMLNTAINEAKLNEQVLQRFIDIEVKMLGSSKLDDLITLLVKDFKQDFKLSVVTLILFDKDELVSPLLHTLPAQIADHLNLINDTKVLSDLYPQKTLRAGELDRDLKKQLFPNNPFVLSCVLLPLINKGQIIGSLHLGARDLNRYHSEYRYDYLERLASLLAVCIENCVIQENLAYLSSTDTLTKLYNRHSFDLEINRALQRASRHKQHLSLLFLDIDHFKRVNDNYGHTGGDAVLKSFAKILKQQIRNTDFSARFGGEEFAILLPDCDSHQAEQIANNLREKIAEHPFDTNGHGDIHITTSIGISSYFFDKPSSQDFSELSHLLLKNSDEALYHAKQTGRNRATFKTMMHNKITANAL